MAFIDFLPLVGDIVQAGVSYANTSKTNSMNLKIARETNQANKDLYEQQFRDTLDLWNRNNEYNAPAAEVSRLRAAGLNPALAYGSNGSAQMAALPSAAPAVGATMQPFDSSSLAGIGSDTVDAILKASQSNLINNQAEQQFIDNQTRSEENRARIDALIAEKEHRLASAGVSRIERKRLVEEVESLKRLNRLGAATYDADVRARDIANEVAEANRDLLIGNNARANVELAVKQYEAETNRQLARAQINHLDSAVQLAYREDWREASEHTLRLSLMRLDRQIKRISRDTQESYRIFSKAMQNSEMMHTKLKDMSVLNKIMEAVNGLGLRDLGGVLSAVAGAGASALK